MILMLAGCYGSASVEPRGSTPPTPPPPEHDTRATPIRSEAMTLADFTRDIQTAPDAVAEGAAIKRLHSWLADRGLTFQTNSVRLETGTAIRDPAAGTERVRTTVSIFRGQQPIHEFSFVPRDNRNLALLGQ